MAYEDEDLITDPNELRAWDQQSTAQGLWGSPATPAVQQDNDLITDPNELKAWSQPAQQLPEGSKPLEAESQLVSGLRSAAHAVPSAIGGAAAGAWGAGLGGLAIGGVPGAIIGAIGGGVVGGFAGAFAKDTALEAIGFDDSHQRAINAATHPWTTAGSEAATAVLGGGPGSVARAGLTGLGRLGETAAVRGISAGIGGGFEAGMQLAQGEELDPVRIASTAGAGAIFARQYDWGNRLQTRGGTFGTRLRPEWQGPIEKPGPWEPEQGPPNIQGPWQPEQGPPNIQGPWQPEQGPPEMQGPRRPTPHGSPGSHGAAGTAEAQPPPSNQPPGQVQAPDVEPPPAAWTPDPTIQHVFDHEAPTESGARHDAEFPPPGKGITPEQAYRPGEMPPVPRVEEGEAPAQQPTGLTPRVETAEPPSGLANQIQNQFDITPNARILYEDTPEFQQLVQPRANESGLDFRTRSSQVARDAGYDGVQFAQQVDSGPIIFDRDKFAVTPKQPPRVMEGEAPAQATPEPRAQVIGEDAARDAGLTPVEIRELGRDPVKLRQLQEGYAWVPGEGWTKVTEAHLQAAHEHVGSWKKYWDDRRERMNVVFAKGGDFPSVSHLLGSDWQTTRNVDTPESYRQAAYDVLEGNARRAQAELDRITRVYERANPVAEAPAPVRQPTGLEPGVQPVEPPAPVVPSRQWRPVPGEEPVGRIRPAQAVDDAGNVFEVRPRFENERHVGWQSYRNDKPIGEEVRTKAEAQKIANGEMYKTTARERNAKRFMGNRTEDDLSLFELIWTRGGLQATPELRKLFSMENPDAVGKEAFGNRKLLRNNGGLSLHDAIHLISQEKRFLWDRSDLGHREMKVGPEDLYKLLDAEARGTKQYQQIEGRTLSKAEIEQGQQRNLHEIDVAVGRYFDANKNDIGEVPNDVYDRTVQNVAKGETDIARAYEAAVMEGEVPPPPAHADMGALTPEGNPKEVVGVTETEPGLWKLTYGGKVLGDSRGYDEAGARRAAESHVMGDPNYYVLESAKLPPPFDFDVQEAPKPKAAPKPEGTAAKNEAEGQGSFPGIAAVGTAKEQAALGAGKKLTGGDAPAGGMFTPDVGKQGELVAGAKAVPEVEQLPKGKGKGRVLLQVDSGKESYATILEQTTFSKALDKHGTQQGLLAPLTAYIRKAVNKIVGDMPVYIVPEAHLDATKGFENAAGAYSRQQNMIVINDRVFKNQPERMAHVILHEGVHAVTAQAIHSHPNVRNAIDAIRKDVRLGLLKKGLTEYPAGVANAFSNEREFVAEAFSKAVFQKLLSEHILSPEAVKEFQKYSGSKSKVKSAWNAIVEKVREILDVPPGQVNALEATMRATEFAMRSNEADKIAHMTASGVKYKPTALKPTPEPPVTKPAPSEPPVAKPAPSEPPVAKPAPSEPPVAKPEVPAAHDYDAKYYGRLLNQPAFLRKEAAIFSVTPSVLRNHAEMRLAELGKGAAPGALTPKPTSAAAQPQPAVTPAGLPHATGGQPIAGGNTPVPPLPPGTPPTPPAGGAGGGAAGPSLLPAHAKDAIDSWWASLQRIFTPEVRPSGKIGMDVFREQKGIQVNIKERQLARFDHESHHAINAMTDADQRKLVDYIEGGIHLKTPGHAIHDPNWRPPPIIQRVVDNIKEGYKVYAGELSRLPQAQQMQFVENYLTHMYKNAGAVRNEGAGGHGGGLGSLKHRKYMTDEEARAAGLEPLTTNPIERFTRYAVAAERALTKQNVMMELEARGRLGWFEPRPIGATGSPEPKITGAAPDHYAEVPSFVNDKGQTAWVPRDMAYMLNHQFAPNGGFGSAATESTANSIRRFKNFTTSVELGLSLYHPFTVGIETAGTGIARALSVAASGDFNTAAKTFANAWLEPFTNVKMGKEWIERYTGKRATAPGEEQKILGALVKADIRPVGLAHTMEYDITNLSPDQQKSFGEMGSLWTAHKRGSLQKEFETHLKEIMGGDYKKGMMLIPNMAARILQTSMQPIFEFYIPRVKMASAVRDLQSWMALNPLATQSQIDAVAKKISNSMDNRVGEMVTDHIGMNKVWKAAAFTLMRSYSFTVGGAVREIGGGALSGVTGALKGENRLSMKSENYDTRVAYALAFPFAAMALGSIYNYMNTGEWPQDWRDTITPRSGGEVMSGGSRVPERVLIPGYHKDFLGYAFHPLHELQAKLSAPVSAIIEQFTGKDYRGDPIAPPASQGLGSHLAGRAAHAGEKLVPISFKQMSEVPKEGSNISWRERALGFRAPGAYIQNQERIAQIQQRYAIKEWRTKERHINADRRARGLEPLPPREFPPR